MNVVKLILTDYTLQIVALGAAILGIISGVLGSFAVIRKESLLGDAVSHSALPGIALAFLITQSKKTEVLLLGALISGLLSTFLILSIVKYSRVKFDSALALILSVFFGGGIVLLTHIQKIPTANQAGLDKFIFGQASTLLKRDVWIMGILGIILISLVIIFWKEFKMVSFDAEFAESLGFSVKKVNLLLSIMIVTAIIVGLQTVGVILMSAMLIAPAVAARQWTDKLSLMVILSSVFGAVSGIIGTVLSSVVSKLPTGPMIVIVISTIVIFSLIFAPNRGLLWKVFRNYKNKKEIKSYFNKRDNGKKDIISLEDYTRKEGV
ncbi:metal ABC transporter permease [Clostridium amazonitimonense]|uniref:metal ABC transporter permease n=1 Tax=Clostridium amazonitimonense TaxID=1499689 RepID=UPI0005098500|nr:iron chelate uptake ABC transporter family permease subunit [Clostridium amazonitimonense]